MPQIASLLGRIDELLAEIKTLNARIAELEGRYGQPPANMLARAAVPFAAEADRIAADVRSSPVIASDASAVYHPKSGR